MSELQARLILQQLTQAFAASPDFPRREVERRQTALLERLARHARQALGSVLTRQRPAEAALPRRRQLRHGGLARRARSSVATRPRQTRARWMLRLCRRKWERWRPFSTSGSTGTPLRFRQTLVQHVASEVLINRTLRGTGCGRSSLRRVEAVAPTGCRQGLDCTGRPRFRRAGRSAAPVSIDPALALPSVAAAWAEAAGEGGAARPQGGLRHRLTPHAGRAPRSKVGWASRSSASIRRASSGGSRPRARKAGCASARKSPGSRDRAPR